MWELSAWLILDLLYVTGWTYQTALMCETDYFSHSQEARWNWQTVRQRKGFFFLDNSLIRRKWIQQQHAVLHSGKFRTWLPSPPISQKAQFMKKASWKEESLSSRATFPHLVLPYTFLPVTLWKRALWFKQRPPPPLVEKGEKGSGSEFAPMVLPKDFPPGFVTQRDMMHSSTVPHASNLL